MIGCLTRPPFGPFQFKDTGLGQLKLSMCPVKLTPQVQILRLEETEPSIELGTFLLKLYRSLPLPCKLYNQRTQRKVAVIR